MTYFYAYKVISSFDKKAGCDHIGLFSTAGRAKDAAERIAGQTLEWYEYSKEFLSSHYNVTQTGITYSYMVVREGELDPDY